SRVPLLFKWPAGIAEPGQNLSQIVECVDVVPTLLACVGIPIPPQVQGDLLPGVTDPGDRAGDGLGLTEHTGWKSLRMDGLRYVATGAGEEFLYDLRQDPWEYSNVAGEPEYASALAEARKALIARMIRIEQPLPRTWPY
ncbi:MAG: sulfatase/phosphatase domain-containing protein, partial [Planctomycetota bacterium]